MPECKSCGRWVSEDFARVFTRHGGDVEGCLTCLPNKQLVAYGAAEDRAHAQNRFFRKRGGGD